MSAAQAARPLAAARVALPTPRLRYLWVLLTLVGTLVGPASAPLNPLDIWWTLLSGKWMVEHHALLTIDPFTSAPQALPQIDAQWLAQLAYYGLYLFGGPALVIMATALIATLAYALVLRACVIASGRLRLSCAALAVGYLLGFTNLAARPQTLVYCIFGAFVLAVTLARERGDHRWLWLPPPLTILWANSHGSFFLGIAYLACAAIGEALSAQSSRCEVVSGNGASNASGVGRGLVPRRWQRELPHIQLSARPAGGDEPRPYITSRLRAGLPYLLAALGCAVAACITPDGPGSVLYVLRLSSNPIIRDLVTEWAPTSIGQKEGVLFFLSVGLLAVVAYVSRRRLRWTDALILLVFGWLAVSSVRAVAWWGLAMAPVLAYLAAGISLPERRSRTATHPARELPLLNWTLLVSIVALLLVSLPWLKTANPFLPPDKRSFLDPDTPVGVASYLATADISGALLTHQSWGSYVEWIDWPHAQPFVDGRIELHPPQVWLDYVSIVYPSARWQTLLDQYGIGTLALDRQSDAGLIDALSQSPLWTRTYVDPQAVVFRRVSPPDS